MKGNWSFRRLAGAVRTSLSLGAMLAFLVGVVLLIGDPSLTRLTVDFLILCPLVIALQVFVGNSGIVSFGHVAYFGIGAYASAILNIPPSIKQSALPLLPLFLRETQQGLFIGILAGAAVSGLVALVVGLAVTRMTEKAMAMATLALLVMMHTVFSNWDSVTRSTDGIYGIPRNVMPVTLLLIVIVIVGVALLFKASPMGLWLQATRDDPVAARSLGINTARVRLVGWVYSAAIMGAGGSLWAQNSLAFGPSQFYYAETFTLLSMGVIGGLASVTGAVAGTALVALISELVRKLEYGFNIGSVIQIPELPGIVPMSIAVMIIVILIFRPAGLLGRWEIDLLSIIKNKGRKRT